MKSVIIYTTKYGSVLEAAKRIAARLGEDTKLINLLDSEVPALENYDTVILGGSIYIGKVQKQLTAFSNSRLRELLSKKVGLFLCAGAPEDEQRKKELEAAFPPALFDQACAKDVLGYAFVFEKMRFLDRLILSKIKGDKNSTAEYFDDRIDRFVQALKRNEA